MTLRTLFFLVVACVLLTRPVGAQTVTDPAVTYTLDIFAAGVPTTGTPTSTTVIPASSVPCGLTAIAPPAGTLDNPGHARFDDPASPGKQCEVTIAAPVQALPAAANYVSTLIANGATTSSPRSAASLPFNRKVIAPPATPKGLIVLP